MKYDIDNDVYYTKKPYNIQYKTNRELSNNLNKLYDILEMVPPKTIPSLYIKDSKHSKLKYEDGLLDICMDFDNEDHVNEIGPRIVGYALGQEYLKDIPSEDISHMTYLAKRLSSYLGLPVGQAFAENVGTYVSYIYNRYLKNVKTYPNAYSETGNKFKYYWQQVYNNFMSAEHLSLHRNLGLLLFDA